MDVPHGPAPLSSDLLDMLRIRRTEETLLRLHADGKITGTTHTSIGQEACAVGVIAALDRTHDVVVSNHRCHGHFLAFTGDLKGLLAEVMGKASGPCHGVGGSQHLHAKNFYSNGVLGGTVAMATGIALAERLAGRETVVCVFMGDGALGEGVVYESFNLAALLSVPLLFVVEANGIAQSTPISASLAGDLAARPRAFGIPTVEVEVRAAAQVEEWSRRLVAEIRSGQGPRCLVLHTFRLGPHSKGDDDRSPEVLATARSRDPLHRLLAMSPPDAVQAAEHHVAEEIAAALRAVEPEGPSSASWFLHAHADAQELRKAGT